METPAERLARESRAAFELASVGQPALCMRTARLSASDFERRSASWSAPRGARPLIPLLMALLLAQSCGSGHTGLGGDRTNSATHSSVGRLHARRAAPNELSPAPMGPGGGHIRPCSAAEVGVVLATDRGVYRMGEPVVFTVTARNDTGASCAVPTGSCLPQVVITASDGAVVWNRAELQVLCTFGRRRV
jgi:hypothetical protein